MEKFDSLVVCDSSIEKMGLWSLRSLRIIPDIKILLLEEKTLSIKVVDILWILVGLVMVGKQPKLNKLSIKFSVGR